MSQQTSTPPNQHTTPTTPTSQQTPTLLNQHTTPTTPTQQQNITAPNTPELWDIYDIHKTKTGRTMIRNTWTMAPGDYYLSVLAAIRIPDGRFLITRRALTKAWAPGWWEIPGGAAQSGETSLQAVLRETLEETGLDLSRTPASLLHTYHRDSPGQNYIVDAYRFDLPFTPSPSSIHIHQTETLDWAFASLKQIQQIASTSHFLHYNSILPVFTL